MQDSNCICLALFSSTTGEASSQLIRAQALLRHAFNALPHVNHVILVRSAGGSPLPPSLASLFTLVPDAGPDSEAPSGRHLHRQLYLLPREPVLPTLHMRHARVEDHDDLVPVFEAQSDVVRSSFGEFFLAETIERQSEHQHVLVGENPEGRAVGLVSISTAPSVLQLDLLNSCFHLEPYNGLRKLTPEQVRGGRVWRRREGRSGSVVSQFCSFTGSRRTSVICYSSLHSTTSQEAQAARAAREYARVRSDWYSLLQKHEAELPALFDAVAAAPLRRQRKSGVGPAGARATAAGAAAAGSAIDDDELVELEDVRAAFNAKGDAWGFVGVGGMRMGTTMLLDLRLHEAVAGAPSPAVVAGCISRSELNEAVAAFAAQRLTGARRFRIASWYVSRVAPTPAAPTDGAAQLPPDPAASSQLSIVLRGRSIVLEEFDKLATGIEFERREAARAAAAAIRATEEAALAAAAAEQASKVAELGDKHAAAGQFAGLFKQAKAQNLQRQAVVAAATTPGHLHSIARADTLQATAQPIRVPTAALAMAITRRLAYMGVAYVQVREGRLLLVSLRVPKLFPTSIDNCRRPTVV
jgi:hypothetical protein